MQMLSVFPGQSIFVSEAKMHHLINVKCPQFLNHDPNQNLKNRFFSSLVSAILTQISIIVLDRTCFCVEQALQQQ
jgi:hypothetical protein